MQKSAVQGIILIFVSLLLTVLSLEAALRIYHGTIFNFNSINAEAPKFAAYHPQLGWIPKSGQSSGSWSYNIDSFGFRSNGRTISSSNNPILAVGDSFTFGYEVEDSETWPAQLEGLLNHRVINAGVGAYGIDQAVLRAELLLDEYHPKFVILAFISDDITRTEYSYFPWGQGPKPYFQLTSGSLILQNVPVPENEAGRSFQSLRQILGYSFLANFVIGRVAPRWWKNLPMDIERVHNHGEDVSVELMIRLDGRARDRGGQLIVISFAANGRIGGNERLSNVIARARESGIQVLDLAKDSLELKPEEFQNLFRADGHYSPEMNGWIADKIATFMQERDKTN